jgi:hypothetical protein
MPSRAIPQKRFLLRIIAAVSLALFTCRVEAATIFNLDYSTETQLPSALGFTYTPLAPAASESSSFSVSAGALRLDTITDPGDFMAYYQLTNGFDHAVDNTLSLMVRVNQITNTFGLMVGVNDATSQLYFNITPTGWSVAANGNSGTFADPSAFHLFRLDTFAATQSFTLAIDGVQVSSGFMSPGYALENLIIFGDGTPTGGDLKAEFQFIRFNAEPTTAIPEPSSLAIAGLGAVSLLIRRSARNRKRAS